LSQQAESRIRFELGLGFHDMLVGAGYNRNVIHVRPRLHEAGLR
jgi:hypothetical protein